MVDKEMILLMSKQGHLFKIGEFFLLFNDETNVSNKDWINYVRAKLNKQ